MDRRKFIKAGMLGGVASALPLNAAHAEVKNQEPIPGALGMLYDSTLCVGCQACVAECQKINGTPVNPKGEQTWSNNDKLSPFTRNVIQVWSEGEGTNKDQPQNGYAYIKKQCMHCVDPNCVSVCPVQALTKNPKTGIVGYDPDICTGCRYCMVACPFDVPKYDYDNPLGQISKCELCNQKGVERIDQGKLPGCCHVCPTGAIIFGSREELMAEAKRRLSMTQGTDYEFPRQHVNSKDKYQAKIPAYEQHIYGEIEGGGTQVLVLSGVPFENLGLPQLDEIATGARAAHLQHTLYRGMILPLVGLAGLTFITYRNMHGKKPEHHQEEDNNE
ncbi:hydrogenase 2 operon protein HybA [Basfia succiniciproducens]|uniref:[NiFe]-hydrogenase II apoprotein, ferredoxin-type subunit n=1 Tax=Basfia succiniciproducens TaxID=653940 RepID=A0A1G5DNS4_9PAST|nr:hydrogenase 2 operon protein HybA [Basfia succiniciproducens]QIM69428.1 hydrogenase 2 protein HybA [Basfia succiniciproducens]SCY16393.1 [NiFe]-hydrogenase II apoprotein, ferredoxin-type subunit [Basfia succiniciproducens]SEQ27152.1 [NiFe]-hydrogenase II apoprotein, ferredoxin-type subunit [Basfia succiniciproducens]